MTFKSYTLGNFTIYKGDAIQVLASFKDNSIGALVTDPPYASSGSQSLTKATVSSKKYVNSGTKKVYPEFQGENRDQRSFAFWATLWMAECYRVCKTGAPALVFSDWRQLPSSTDYLQAGGFTFNGIVPWDKTESTRPSKGKFRNQAEYIAWGFKGKCFANSNPVYLSGAIRERVNSNKKLHMTGKPEPVMDHLLKIVAPNETVVDPFMGSGTTGVAALNQGKKFIGIEATDEYFEIAKKRLQHTHEQILKAA